MNSDKTTAKTNRYDEPMVRVNLWVTKDSYDRLTELAKLDGMATSDVIRVALRDFLKKNWKVLQRAQQIKMSEFDSEERDNDEQEGNSVCDGSGSG